MKLLLCADVRLGAVCAEDLDEKLSHKWQAARTEAFTDLIDRAAATGASYVALFGRVFGRDRVPESVIDGLFGAAKENGRVQVLAFLNGSEFARVSYRGDVPENLHLIQADSNDSYTDDVVALRVKNGITELQLSDNDSLYIRKTESGFRVTGLGEDQMIPSFEPVGFEDARELRCGTATLEWTQEAFVAYTVDEKQKYAYRETEIRILPGDDQKEILRKINMAVREIDIDSFLRVTLTGKSAFGITLDSDALKSQLQGRIFYVEVYDNTVMDIDEGAFENDISLRSEFVRLALSDDTLSESERSRLISCGWNVLNGKGADVQ